MLVPQLELVAVGIEVIQQTIVPAHTDIAPIQAVGKWCQKFTTPGDQNKTFFFLVIQFLPIQKQTPRVYTVCLIYFFAFFISQYIA